MNVSEAIEQACAAVGIIPPKGGYRPGQWAKCDTLAGKLGNGCDTADGGVQKANRSGASTPAPVLTKPTLSEVNMADKPLCKIDGCGKPARNSRGWCAAHYDRWRMHGDPLGGRTPRGELSRWLNDVAFSHGGDECLLWPFSRFPNGYAKIRHKGRSSLVHRLVCERVNGPAPSVKHEAAHSCGNGHLGCVSQSHLSWKTPVENAADKLEHGTNSNGENNAQAKLSEEDIHEIRRIGTSLPQHKIGAMFGVSQSNVSLILSGKHWRRST